MKKRTLLAALVVLLPVSFGAANAQGKMFQFMFINHVNRQLHFYALMTLTSAWPMPEWYAIPGSPSGRTGSK